jgi:hypothetical protein
MRYLKVAVYTIITCAVLLYAVSMVPPRPAHAQSVYAPFQCRNSVAVSSASSVQIVTASNSNMIIFVCSISLGSIGGSSFSMVEGTGSTCGTNTVAVAGGTTAAAGYGIAANGSPVAVGGGIGPVAHTVTRGDNLCLIIAGTGPLAGVVSYSQSQTDVF